MCTTAAELTQLLAADELPQLVRVTFGHLLGFDFGAWRRFGRTASPMGRGPIGPAAGDFRSKPSALLR